MTDELTHDLIIRYSSKNVFNFRLFRVTCNGCGMFISPKELVMRAQGYVYHLQCFMCVECGQQLQRGDHYVIRDGQLFCRLDYEKEFHMMAYSPKSKLILSKLYNLRFCFKSQKKTRNNKIARLPCEYS